MSRHASPAKGKKSKKSKSPVRNNILEDTLENNFDASAQDMTPERARLQEVIEASDKGLKEAMAILERANEAVGHVTK